MSRKNNKNYISLENDKILDEEKIPIGQLLLNMPFFLLTIGMFFKLLFYTVWGLYEVMSLPEY